MIKVKFDTRLFETGMLQLQSEARRGTMLGMKRAMTRFKNDALTKPPACPVETGWMADHHVTAVEMIGNKVQGKLSVVATSYAASLHEGISRWGTPYAYKTPGTGMKWIESKALMYKDGYVRNILDGFAQSIRSWSRRFRRMFK